MATRNGLERGPDYRNVAVWPLVLIAGGVVLFAANFGWLRWDALWSVGYLWPLVLVAVGVDVLLGGQHRLLVVLGTLVAAVIIYLATAGSLGFGAAGIWAALAIGLAVAAAALAWRFHLRTRASPEPARTDSPETSFEAVTTPSASGS